MRSQSVPPLTVLIVLLIGCPWASAGAGKRSPPPPLKVVERQNDHPVSSFDRGMHMLSHTVNTIAERVRTAEHNAALAATSTFRDRELEEENVVDDAESDATSPPTPVPHVLTEESAHHIAQAATLPGQGTLDLNQYFLTLEKDDGHDHMGRSDGTRLHNELPHPACIDACREDTQCVAVSYRPQSLDACILLSSVQKRFEAERAWVSWFKESDLPVDSDGGSFAPNPGHVCQGGHRNEDTSTLEQCEAQCARDFACTCFDHKVSGAVSSCRVGHHQVATLDGSDGGYTAYLRQVPATGLSHLKGGSALSAPVVAVACHEDNLKLRGF